jgi:hypothetical protein
VLVQQACELLEALLEVQRGVDALQPRAQAHHRERHGRLDADDHGLRPAQPRHVGKVGQRAGPEGIQHVKGGHVDDDALGTVLADLLHELPLEPHDLLVVQRLVDRGDQVVALS